MLKIDTQVVDAANASFLSLDELAHLFSLYFDQKWNLNLTPAHINKLKRLGAISEDGKLTTGGELVLFSCIGNQPKPKTTTEETDRFDEIWLMFPRDDGFRHFSKSRTIRWNKPETRRQYAEALKNYTHEQLVGALQAELKYRTVSSTKDNFFKYMKGSANWFKDAAFLNFLDEEETNDDINDYGKEVS